MLILVLSHPDEDHYIWIPDIVFACIQTVPDIVVKKIYLGGSKEHYNGKFKSFLANYEGQNDESSSSESGDEEETDIVEFLTAPGATTDSTTILQKGNIKYCLLPAKQALQKSDSNDGSLVVVVKYYGFVMPIMGDATGVTTAHISEHEELQENEERRFTILHAAHHGASSHGSNGVAWLNRIKPDCVVFSSGVNTGLKHPRRIIVERVLLQPFSKKETGNQYRSLHVGLDESTRLNIYAKGSRGYGLAVTNGKFFSTLSDGTITFTERVGAPPSVNYSVESSMYDSEKSCAMEALMKFPRGLLKEEHLTEINLSGLGVDDSLEEDKNRLHRLIDSLKAKASQLETISMAKNIIGTIESLEKICSLLTNRPVINYFDITENAFEEVDKQKLRDLSGRRQANGQLKILV